MPKLNRICNHHRSYLAGLMIRMQERNKKAKQTYRKFFVDGCYLSWIWMTKGDHFAC